MRALLVASIATGVVIVGDEVAFAQARPDRVETLPPVEVSPDDRAMRGGSRSGTRAARARPKAVYVPTAPTPTSDSAATVEADQVPASVNVVDSREIARTDSLNITTALEQRVPGISINEVTGNPFQPDIQFRGFVASPVAGTPQGLAVYQNGVRINEAFGDTVNWDLIPTTAVRSIDVVTNNPAFGLNALGGAVVVQMKDGFSYQGAELNTLGVRSAASRGRGNGASRSTITRSMARSRACTTTASAISRRPTFAVSTATSATGATSANSISMWASPTIISVLQRPCRSSCCRIIGERLTRHHKPPTTRSATSI